MYIYIYLIYVLLSTYGGGDLLWALALVAHSWLLEGSNTPKAGEDPRADVPAHRAGPQHFWGTSSGRGGGGVFFGCLFVFSLIQSAQPSTRITFNA